MKINSTGQLDCFHVKKTMASLAVLALTLCLFSSCASDVASRYYGATRYPPKQVNEVQLLRESPARPYEVIADFQSRGETPEDMRRRAAQIGADGVIVSTLGGYRAKGEEWAGSDSNSGTYTRITGTAIKYKD
jgi:hypothetical protein